jgi:hypothetical protein
MLFLFLVTTTTIHKQEASSFFYENLFGEDCSIEKAQLQMMLNSQIPGLLPVQQTGTPDDDNIRGQVKMMSW